MGNVARNVPPQNVCSLIEGPVVVDCGRLVSRIEGAIETICYQQLDLRQSLETLEKLRQLAEAEPDLVVVMEEAPGCVGGDVREDASPVRTEEFSEPVVQPVGRSKPEAIRENLRELRTRLMQQPLGASQSS